MTFKDVLAPVLTLEDDEAALMAAAELAEQFDGRAIALHVAVHVGSAFAEQQALSAVLEDIAKGLRSKAAVERERINAWTKKSSHDFVLRNVTIENAVNEDEIVAHARVADLIVIARAERHDAARRALLEDVLFKSGRPVLVTPSRPLRPRHWKRLFVAWNATAEATHAVAAAMPLLRGASEAAVATVDAKPSRSGHGEAPGHELAAHLAKHGVRVHVRNVDSAGRSDSKALLDEAAAFDADVIVMGAYGHSRAREFLFGGATRDLLESSPIPLFMAH
jgi:nucleotide-binding universal stress UspA family protein